MKVLYVTGSCLTRNTSANMSHNAFVQGLLENGCELDILSAAESWGMEDSALPVWEKARYFTYPSVSVQDRLRLSLRGKAPAPASAPAAPGTADAPKRPGAKAVIRQLLKKAFYRVFRPDPLYPLEKEWLKNAVKFNSEEHYDLVVSNSSPAASHCLVEKLREKGRLRFDRWIQIWEDPWSHDLYGHYPPAIEEEEHRLLRAASEIAYVSPLTLMYQKQYFPDCADKMFCIPLPALRYESDAAQDRTNELSFGYFGDYYSAARDLRPFYEAVVAAGCRAYIYGDTDLHLERSEKVEISPRVTLDRLKAVQEKASVLVHLSNLRGGQIPGKIYHYSVTSKPILFILDGSKEEKEALLRFFSQYDRYCFCDNSVNNIRLTMERIAQENRMYAPVKDFYPENIVKQLLAR